MKVIVGLGNPGEKYSSTRHNAGYMFIDFLAADNRIAEVNRNIELKEDKKFKAQTALLEHDGKKVLLVKPTTYMNSSGESVSSILKYYKSTSDDLVVVLDDVDLPVGIVRVRDEGSSAGHKGLQNIIDCLDSDKFVRFRIGISDYEKRNTEETAEYVLDDFSKRDRPIIERSIEEAVSYLLQYLGTKEKIPSHTLEIKVNTKE